MWYLRHILAWNKSSAATYSFLSPAVVAIPCAFYETFHSHGEERCQNGGHAPSFFLLVRGQRKLLILWEKMQSKPNFPERPSLHFQSLWLLGILLLGEPAHHWHYEQRQTKSQTLLWCKCLQNTGRIKHLSRLLWFISCQSHTHKC